MRRRGAVAGSGERERAQVAAGCSSTRCRAGCATRPGCDGGLLLCDAVVIGVAARGGGSLWRRALRGRSLVTAGLGNRRISRGRPSQWVPAGAGGGLRCPGTSAGRGETQALLIDFLPTPRPRRIRSHTPRPSVSRVPPARPPAADQRPSPAPRAPRPTTPSPGSARAHRSARPRPSAAPPRRTPRQGLRDRRRDRRPYRPATNARCRAAFVRFPPAYSLARRLRERSVEDQPQSRWARLHPPPRTRWPARRTPRGRTRERAARPPSAATSRCLRPRRPGTRPARGATSSGHPVQHLLGGARRRRRGWPGTPSDRRASRTGAPVDFDPAHRPREPRALPATAHTPRATTTSLPRAPRGPRTCSGTPGTRPRRPGAGWCGGPGSKWSTGTA